MTAKRPAKLEPISTREAMTFGITLLAQVSGTLIVSALLGWLADELFNTAPIGLAVGVAVGGAVATVTVLTKVKAKLTE